jgi:hypothetical protein
VTDPDLCVCVCDAEVKSWPVAGQLPMPTFILCTSHTMTQTHSDILSLTLVRELGKDRGAR